MNRPKNEYAGYFALAATALLSIAFASCAAPGDGNEAIQEPPYSLARPESATEPMTGARNVVVMIADGMGFNQLKAASYYRGGAWPDAALASFSLALACSTYPAGFSYDPERAWSDFGYPRLGATDSAAAATALATGFKTDNGRIATDVDGNPLETVLETAERSGKLTGIVTSVPIGHATPAAFAAHAKSRSDERELARAILFVSRLDVIMGCGNPERDEDGEPYADGARYDWISQATWDALVSGTAANDRDGDGTADPWVLARDRAEIAALASAPDFSHVVAVPNVHSTLQQKRGGDASADAFAVPLNEGVPTLAEMSLAALNLLSKGTAGFALMIEGGAVDWAGHANQSGRMIEEASDFLDAVNAVCQWLDDAGLGGVTLVVVVADHETGFLLGESGWPPFTAIGNNGAGNMPDMEWNGTGHTNGLVPFFARGANAGHFANDIRGFDSRRGWYIDNTDIGRRIRDMLE